MDALEVAATEALPGVNPGVPAAAPPAASGGSDLAKRTAMILNGPVIPTMLRLGLPTLVVMMVQTLVGLVETYFLGFLGTDALAGVALVFPVLMLMLMMSNGGIGGGVSSAVARSIGAGRRADTQALVYHALVLAVVLGGTFTGAVLIGGRALYHALGAEGGALRSALAYSNWVFAAAIPIWAVALLSAVLRGAGNVKVPAVITFCGAALTITLSPALIFGLGPLPRMGIAGSGVAMLVYYLGAAAVLLAYLRSPRGTLRLERAPLQWRLFKDILGVGALSAVGNVQTNLTVALVTGAVALYAEQAIAGFGVASRLDYLLVPVMFGFGTGVVTMVATHMGAGNVAHARRIAWIGAGLAFAVTEAIGVLAAVFAAPWARLYTDDPAVIATTVQYLRIVGLFYGFFGLGIMLYFAAQGANRVIWAVLSGTLRLAVAGVAGLYAARMYGLSLTALFWIVAAGLVVFGLGCALSMLLDDWRHQERAAARIR